MRRSRVIAAVTASIAIATCGVPAVSAIDAPPHAAAAASSVDVTPSRRSVASGTYVAYVRAVPGDDRAVAVDFVAVTGRAAGNRRLVDAGLIAKVGLFDSVGRPFRITIKNNTIVSAQSADDILSTEMPNGAAPAARVSLSTTKGGQ